MNRLTDVESIIRNLPLTFKIPTNFNEFVSMVTEKEPQIYGFFEVVWTNPEDFELITESAKSLIPFLRFGDGGLAAFWINTKKSIPIIYISSEGEYFVSAGSFDEFVLRIELHKTGISDIDDFPKIIEFDNIKKDKVEISELSLLNQKFGKWYKKHSALQHPLYSNQSEEIRKILFDIASQMIADGLSKVDTLDSVWWSMYFTITNKNGRLEATYLDYGEWFSVPRIYRLEEAVLKLIPVTKSKSLESFELSISSPGIVSINRDRELALTQLE